MDNRFLVKSIEECELLKKAEDKKLELTVEERKVWFTIYLMDELKWKLSKFFKVKDVVNYPSDCKEVTQQSNVLDANTLSAIITGVYNNVIKDMNYSQNTLKSVRASNFLKGGKALLATLAIQIINDNIKPIENKQDKLVVSMA